MAAEGIIEMQDDNIENRAAVINEVEKRGCAVKAVSSDNMRFTIHSEWPSVKVNILPVESLPGVKNVFIKDVDIDPLW